MGELSGRAQTGALGTPSTQNQSNPKHPGAPGTQLTVLGSHFSSCGPELGDQVGKRTLYPNHLRRIYVVSDDSCLETALLRVSREEVRSVSARISLLTLLTQLPFPLRSTPLFSFEVTHRIWKTQTHFSKISFLEPEIQFRGRGTV